MVKKSISNDVGRLSGLVGLVLTLNFLNTENKVSKAGYHNITTMNKTENSVIFLKNQTC